MPTPITAAEIPFAERVHEAEAGAWRVLALPTPVERVVSFAGSFVTQPDFAAGEELLQRLAVRLLDRGTRRRDRFALAEALERRGAQLSFHDDGLRCGFAGRVLREDLEEVLALAAEQLAEPLFDPEEFEKAKARQAAALRRAMESTGAQAGGALARRLYPPGHPNFRPEPEAELARLEATTVEDVRAFHEAHFGARRAALALAGDLEPTAAAEAVRAHLGGWSEPEAAPTFETAAAPEPPGRENVPIPERHNLDVRIGHALALRRDSADYLALRLGTFILGGNFSARLMASVRDEQGLTYGIGSALSGLTVEYDGYWVTSVSLSGEHLERGIEATLAEIRRLVEDGITEEELAEKQTTLAGTFRVRLATTGGLASALLANAERGFEVDYLDRFPALVGALTREEVDAAIRRHLDPGALHVAVAGTLPT